MEIYNNAAPCLVPNSDDFASRPRRIYIPAAEPQTNTQEKNTEDVKIIDYAKLAYYVKNLFRLHSEKGLDWANEKVIQRFGICLKEKELQAFKIELEQDRRLSKPKPRRAGSKSRVKSECQLSSKRKFKSRLKAIIHECMFPLMVWFGIKRLTFAAKNEKFVTEWTALDGKKDKIESLL